MAAHVDWRLLLYGNNGSGFYVGMTELQMYDATGHYLSVGGTASSSSNGAGTLPAGAFDNNMGTGWLANSPGSTGAPEWIRYTFAGAVDVAVVRIVATGSVAGTDPGSFKLQYSDDSGATWNDATGIIVPFGWNATNSNIQAWAFTVPAAAIPGGQYVNWRLRCITSLGTYLGAAEIGFKSVAGGSVITSPTPTQYCIAWTTNGAPGLPGAAFDGNASTVCRVSNGSGLAPDSWLGYAFAQPYRVVEVDFTNDSAGTWTTTSPTKIALEASNDCGATWTTIETFTLATWTGPGQTQILGVTADERGRLAYNQIRSVHRNGAGGQVQMFGGGATHSGYSVAWDNEGNIIDPNLGFTVTRAPSVPAHASTLGTPGQVAMDGSGNLYWCYATNQWARIGPAGWSNTF
jgi:hypothetical protein